MTIKSTITKRTIGGKKFLKQLKKKASKETRLEREREREWERERELTFFAMNNLEGIGERGGNEVKEIY